MNVEFYVHIPYRSHHLNNPIFAAQRGAFPTIRQIPYPMREQGSFWTNGFVSLADPYQDVVPFASVRFTLKESGLGEMKIVFSLSGGWEKI